MFRGYVPEIPMMFVYGADKVGRLHSEQWLEFVRSRPGNEVVAFDGTDHWVTKDSRLKVLLGNWLERSGAN